MLGEILSGGAALYTALEGSGSRRRDVRLGHEYDLDFSLRKEDELWKRAKARGLTPQEYYGSSAAGGAGGGVSGGAQVLGNSKTHVQTAKMQALTQLGNAAAERQTRLDVARVQADAQKYSADKAYQGVGDQIVGNVAIQELRNLIEQQKFNLNERTFKEVTLPAAQEKLRKTKQEVNKLLNEVATSTPKWQRWKVLTQLGFDNTIQNMLINKHGIDPTSKESMQGISDQKFKAILAAMIANSSYSFKEFSGIGTSLKTFFEWLQSLPKANLEGLMKTPTFTGPPARH